MAHLTAYNTSDPDAGPQGYTLLAGNGVYTSQIITTETAQAITGTVASDQSGTLLIQQSFDGGNNWDGVTSVAVTGGTPVTFNVPVVAPWAQITYTNGATPQASYFRLFARTFATGR